MRWFLLSLTATAVLLAAWLILGRHVSLLLDRLGTIHAATLPTTPITFSPGRLQIGDRAMLFPLEDGQSMFTVQGNILTSHGKSFKIENEPGDVLSYTIHHSLLSWPTPLELNFMTGFSPTWKRHLYHRFLWKKANGASLFIECRYEQWLYTSLGWSGLEGMHSLKTGPPRIVIIQSNESVPRQTTGVRDHPDD